VQMPRGIPVASVAVNGSANAGILAVEMLSISDDDLAEQLAAFRAAGAR
jgi:5-(carboxyamino)imidazole ribonucleotide mutase